MSTILDDLDVPEVGIAELSAGLAAATFCPKCGHVDDEMEFRRYFPCKTCGRECGRRRILFGGEEQEFVTMIFECYRSKHSRPACLLLSCSLMELHLRMLILHRWRWLGIKWPSLTTTLKEKWRFKQQTDLFASLTGTSLFELQLTKRLFSRHVALVSKRDKLAHGLTGAAWLVTREEVRSSVELAAESFKIFAQLHHKYCSVDAPPLPKA
jgi:hypothetical protein